MITASEAAKQAENNAKDFNTEELKKIEFGINHQIAKGEREYAYDGYISHTAMEALTDIGYFVRTGQQYNQPWVRIKW